MRLIVNEIEDNDSRYYVIVNGVWIWFFIDLVLNFVIIFSRVGDFR